MRLLPFVSPFSQKLADCWRQLRWRKRHDVGCRVLFEAPEPRQLLRGRLFVRSPGNNVFLQITNPQSGIASGVFEVAA